MIHRNINAERSGEVVYVPTLTEKEKAEVDDFLVEAKRIQDEEGEYIVGILLDAITRLEAGTRNMARTLNVYRGMIPKLIRVCNKKIQQEEVK